LGKRAGHHYLRGAPGGGPYFEARHSEPVSVFFRAFAATVFRLGWGGAPPRGLGARMARGNRGGVGDGSACFSGGGVDAPGGQWGATFFFFFSRFLIILFARLLHGGGGGGPPPKKKGRRGWPRGGAARGLVFALVAGLGGGGGAEPFSGRGGVAGFGPPFPSNPAFFPRGACPTPNPRALGGAPAQGRGHLEGGGRANHAHTGVGGARC